MSAIVSRIGKAGGGATFNVAPGSYSANDGGAGTTVNYTITANKSVVWSWSVAYLTGSAGASADIVTGSKAVSITLTLNPTISGRQAQFTVTVNGQTWVVTLTTAATGGGGTVTTISVVTL